MNKQRRKEIKDIITQLEDISIRLGNVMSDEQDAFDSMPEGLQESLRGYDSQEAIDNMEEASGTIQNAIESLENIV